MASVPVKPVSTVQSGVSQPNITAAARAHTNAVAVAVARLNEAGVAGVGREVTFSLDPATKRPVVKVIEADTKEVVSQWPSEYALALAEDYDPLKETRDSR